MIEEKLKLQLLTVVIVAFIFVIGGITAVNKLNANKIERQKNVRLYEIEQERKYDVCQENAWASYRLSWKNECIFRGLIDDCGLPVRFADSLDETREKAISSCIKMYKKY